MKVKEIINEYNTYNLIEKCESQIKDKIDVNNWDLANPNIKNNVKRSKVLFIRRIMMIFYQKWYV